MGWMNRARRATGQPLIRCAWLSKSWLQLVCWRWLSKASGGVNRGPALVVAPTSVTGNWLQEAQRFAPTLNATFVVNQNTPILAIHVVVRQEPVFKSNTAEWPGSPVGNGTPFSM